MLALALAVTAGLLVVMALAWLVQRRLHNAGWVDVFWSFGTGIAGAIAAIAPLPGGPADWPTLRALAVGSLALLWGCRLGAYLARRTAGGHREDVRYARFRQEWGRKFQSRLFWFLMIQAVVAALLALCVMLAAHNPAPAGRPADRQMQTFRANKQNRGKVCDTGLWGLSRHPNYFFECLAWCAYPFFAIGPHYPAGYAALLGPAAMIWLLTKVSGIPPLEREMVADRGDAYRRYQETVSAFLPLPPRRNSP